MNFNMKQVYLLAFSNQRALSASVNSGSSRHRMNRRSADATSCTSNSSGFSTSVRASAQSRSHRHSKYHRSHQNNIIYSPLVGSHGHAQIGTSLEHQRPTSSLSAELLEMDILPTLHGGVQVDDLEPPGLITSLPTPACLWPINFLWHRIVRSAGQSLRPQRLRDLTDCGTLEQVWTDAFPDATGDQWIVSATAGTELLSLEGDSRLLNHKATA